MSVMSAVEIIDAIELAKRWQVPATWIRNWTQRFEWGLRPSRTGGKSADDDWPALFYLSPLTIC